jgi:acetylornithine deacetylase/succinyl-diaminopimelate desuccinylase-like protein
VRNPLQALAEICASLHDPNGRVNLPGFYDNVEEPCTWDREQLEKTAITDKEYGKLLGVAKFHTVDGVPPLEATRFWPTLEFNGMGGGYQGEGSKTIVPSKAFVKISCRLVPNQEPAEVVASLTEALQTRCPSGIEMTIRPGQEGMPYAVHPPARPGSRRDGESAVIANAFTCAEEAIEEVFGEAPFYLREGGSIPIISDLKDVCGMDSLMIGMFTPESNLHAPNENLHLGMFSKGIDVSERILRGVSARGARAP